MTSNIFEDIKDRVNLKDLVRFYGLEVDRGGFACCPFHNEKHPSFKSMKIITTASAVVNTEITLTLFRSCMG